jgi:hypothetical protein
MTPTLAGDAAGRQEFQQVALVVKNPPADPVKWQVIALRAPPTPQRLGRESQYFGG